MENEEELCPLCQEPCEHCSKKECPHEDALDALWHCNCACL